MTQHIITTETMAAFRRYLMAAERRPVLLNASVISSVSV